MKAARAVRVREEEALFPRKRVVIDTMWAFYALADECIGERTCEVCGATPGQPCRPKPHGWNCDENGWIEK
ncbi:hypothetical protein OHA25_17250 [Nonomuraea sp. NBC_00507]|uniref:hypothetical protein n=1 Tax=Nonomuraea sp. NBC_00507 TaxID=2976002 RepID=UPI002E173D17